MINTLNYDLFVSYSSVDKERVESIVKKITALGINVFFDKNKLKTGQPFTREIEEAIESSRHFFVFFSKSAANSNYVNLEWTTFLNNCHLKDTRNRSMYVFKTDGITLKDMPTFLASVQHPSSEDDFINDLNKTLLDGERRNINELEQELHLEKLKVDEARHFYLHDRFWKHISNEHERIHIFTCGRDVQHESQAGRGYGGRTNIDFWDYRTVFDLTHFFSSRYRDTKITIEDPASKLAEDALRGGQLQNRLDQIKDKLFNKNCVIVGSPDVSDFAEKTLAEIYKIAPYDDEDERTKNSGYIIIKEIKTTISSFYWQKRTDELEGVAQISEGGSKITYFPNVNFQKGRNLGKMYGILVVSNNPFCDDNNRKKIIILSGFSGIATNAIAKLITDKAYIKEFYKLDTQYSNLSQSFEALIGVEFSIEDGFAKRDTRVIKKISFEGFVEINN